MTGSGLDKAANYYYGGTITNAPENSDIYGITQNGTDANAPLYSYITPLTADGKGNDDYLFAVDRDTNKVGRVNLVTLLNSWVEDNQTEDNAYSKWEKDKTTGKPVLKAKEESVSNKKYDITSEVTGKDYGETTVDVEAASDSKVTVYTSPKQFCKLKSISVTTADGKEVEVTKNEDGTYSFTMPKSAVTVKTEYAETAHAITTTHTGEGTVTVQGNETLSSEKANEGETVTVKVTADRLKYATSGTVKATTASGKEVELTAVSAINGSDGHTYTFTMPDEAVTISADFQDASSYYNEDGSLKEGTYKMKAIFGSTYDIDSDKVTGAMGYEEQYSNVTVKVDKDGNVSVEDYEMPGVKSPQGYAGGGELYVKPTATPDSNGNGIIKGSDDAGVVEDKSDAAKNHENFKKVYSIVPTVTKTGTVNSGTNIKTDYDGEFYFTKVVNGGKQVGGFYNTENVESVKLTELSTATSTKVAPFNFNFSGVNYIKNDADYANQNVLFTTYITEMAYISEVLFRMDFSTIEKVQDNTDKGQETVQELNATVYSACEPGGTKTPPATIDAIKSAKLVTKADGSRQIEFDLGETVVFGLHGHMGSLRIYNSASMQDAFKEISKNDQKNLVSATYSNWYTDKINTEADSVAYDQEPVAVTDSRGYVYFTKDGSQFTASSTTTDLENNLVYPGKAVIDVPDYFNLTDNNEIYLTGFIDGMSKDTNLKLKLTEKSANTKKTGTAHISQFGEYDVDGQFSADSFVKVYWDSIKKTGDLNDDKKDDVNDSFEFGSNKVKLAAGTYNIPAKLKNATNPSQDSMAAGCVQSATMTVDKDGNAKVTLNLAPVSFAGLTAYATDWKIYQGTDTNSETVAAEVTHTNEDGKVDQITFTLPNRNYDGVYTNMFVDAMQYSPDAYLALDYANAQKVEDEVTDADYTTVDKALASVPKDLSVYTDESVKVLNDAIAAVDRNKKSNEQEAVDAMAKAINDAVAGLVRKTPEVKKADYTAVDNALATVPKDLSGYTDDSVKALNDAIAAVDRNKNSDEQEAVDAMAKAINDAVANLVQKETKKDDQVLADGVYSISGSMVKPDKKTASMSDKAINHVLKLTVKNGKYYITVKLNGLTVGQKLGYLSKLKYFTTGYTVDKYGNPQGTLADVTVNGYQKNSDGSLISDDYGTDYPDEVTFELIPEAIKDGYVPLQVFVPIMDAISAGTGTQPVFLKLDWASVKATTADDPSFDNNDNNNNSNGNNNGSSDNSNGNNGNGSDSNGNSDKGASIGNNTLGGNNNNASTGNGSSLNNGSGLKSASSVKTADMDMNQMRVLWATVLAAAAAMAAGFAGLFRRKRNEEDE